MEYSILRISGKSLAVKFLILIISIIDCLALITLPEKKNSPPIAQMAENENKAEHYLSAKLIKSSSALKTFTVKGDYNPKVAFIVDLSIKSGRNRFFIYNLKKDSIEY